VNRNSHIVSYLHDKTLFVIKKNGNDIDLQRVCLKKIHLPGDGRCFKRDVKDHKLPSF